MFKFLGNFSLKSELISKSSTKKIMLVSGSSLSKGNLNPRMPYVLEVMSNTEKDLQNYVCSKDKKADITKVLLEG